MVEFLEQLESQVLPSSTQNLRSSSSKLDLGQLASKESWTINPILGLAKHCSRNMNLKTEKQLPKGTSNRKTIKSPTILS